MITAKTDTFKILVSLLTAMEIATKGTLILCRYFSLYGKCKFNDKCAYLHKRSHDSELENLRLELSAVKEEVAMLVNKIEALQKKNSEMDEYRSSDYATNSYQSLSTLSIIPQVDGNLTFQEDDTTLPPLSLECEICDLEFHDIDFYDEHNAYSHCCTTYRQSCF